MRIRQSTLKFLERDVWVLMDQLDQKVMVEGEPSITGVARVIGWRQAQPLLELLSKARRRSAWKPTQIQDAWKRVSVFRMPIFLLNTT